MNTCPHGYNAPVNCPECSLAELGVRLHDATAENSTLRSRLATEENRSRNMEAELTALRALVEKLGNYVPRRGHSASCAKVVCGNGPRDTDFKCTCGLTAALSECEEVDRG